ncbi:hypothetical protein CHARACLAT_009339 [Characodon lateralis]|uniref:Uncharacterized protein n=1 Tax=Characodon lateralis TaxID=208331 RepID=A0ABU7DFK9_9TELE|nr:hypothetical protein [Characodon lateralis]
MIKTQPLVDSGSVSALNPARSLLRPNGAFTGGSLPVNMCGPAAKAGCNWTTKHTPPQAPTAPPFPAKEGNATLEGCSIQNNDARMEKKRDGNPLTGTFSEITRWRCCKPDKGRPRKTPFKLQ